MALEIKQNVAIPISLYKRLRGFCHKRDWTIWKTVARWCKEGMNKDRDAENKEGKK